jgi:hypothetical protein
MKGTFKKIWYTFSVILIIAGMVLVLPGAMYGGDDSSQTTAPPADSVITTAAADTITTAAADTITTADAETTTTVNAESTTTIAPDETTTTIAPEDTTTTITTEETTTTIDPNETTTTVASEESTTTSVSEETTTTMASAALTGAKGEEKGSVTLTLTADTAGIIANFYLKDTEGKYFTSTGMAVSKEDILAKQSITSDGTYTWTSLPLNTYKIEMDPISGYVSTANPDTFTIDVNNIKQVVAVNINTALSETTSTVPETTNTVPETATSTVPETTVADTTPPVIVLNGDAVINLKKGDTFTDPGAKAIDNKDTEIAVTTIGTVNTNFVGSYTISYNASDSAGNIALTVSRTVNVVEGIYSASLNVVANPQTVKPGEKVTFKIIVNNTGIMPLSNIKITDKLPEVVIFNSADGFIYDDVSREASFTIANLNPGEIYQKEIVVTVPIVAADSLTLTNTANISGEKIITVQKTVDINLSTSAETDLTVLGIKSYNPFLYTDKDDYQPGEKVTLFGEGFVPGENVQVIFYAITAGTPDGKIEHVTVINNVSADGTFVYEYNIIGAAEYRVEARSIVENENGSTTTLESGTTEINVAENAIDIALGSLLAMTYFTDCAPTDIEINVKKHVVNPDGTDYIDGTASFKIKVKRSDASSALSATLKDNESHLFVFSNASSNNYTITEEDIPSGYTFEYFTVEGNSNHYSNGASIYCNPGSIIYVHMYNYKSPEYGSVTITKKVDGLTPASGSFSFYYTIDGGAHIPFTLSSVNNWTITIPVIVGKSYVIVEDDPGPNWILPTITKISGNITFNIDESTRSVSFIPNCDGTIVYNNIHKSYGSIVVDKTVANGLTSGVFTFNISKVGDATWTYAGTPVVITYPGNTGNKTFTDLDLNATYLVTETSSGTNIPFTSASVPADGLIALTTTAPGTISFTNTGIKGSIHITKSLIGGLVGGIYTFSITANDAGSTWTHPDVTINLDDADTTNDSVLITEVPFGSYTVTENIPAGATYHVTIPSNGILTASPSSDNPDVTAAFTNGSNSYSVSVQKATIGSGFSGSFTFELQRVELVNGETIYNTISTLAISTSGGNAAFPVNESNPITAGTYRVVETGRGGAAYTDVSNSGIPAGSAVNNMTSPIFVLNEGNTSQTVYFVNSIPGPSSGSIMIVKNVTVTQGADTTFTFTITPAVNGVSLYNVIVPANQSTSTFTINGVPFGVKYSISEDSLPGWFLQSSEGLTFTLNAAATLATPVFTNTPTGGGTTTTAGITVAGLSTGGIEVLGIQELPFTGSRDTLFKFGIVFIIFGLMMMILLPIALRSGKHLRTR